MCAVLTKTRARRLRKLIQARVDAEVAFSWKGGGDPDEIEAELKRTCHDLDYYINYLVNSQEIR